MNIQTAEQELQTLKAEQAALPGAIKAAIQRMERSEVRRLQAREAELADLIADAELALLDAQIAALPNQHDADQGLRHAEALLNQAQQAHIAAVQRLVAAQDVWRAALSAALYVGVERDRLNLAREEVSIRSMPGDEAALYSVTGYRM